MTNPTLTISFDHLRSALMQWEEAARGGLCRPVEEVAQLPVEQVVDESTDFLWAALRALSDD